VGVGIAGKIDGPFLARFRPLLTEVSHVVWRGAPLEMTDGTKVGAQRARSLRPRCVREVDPETAPYLSIYLSMIKPIYWYSCKVTFLLDRYLLNFNFIDKASKHIWTSNFIKLHPVGAKLFHVDRRTDMKKLIAVFHNSANVSIKIPLKERRHKKLIDWNPKTLLQKWPFRVSIKKVHFFVGMLSCSLTLLAITHASLKLADCRFHEVLGNSKFLQSR
jgi:hypothetical protein